MLRAMATPGVHESALSLLTKYVGPAARIVDLGAGQGAFSQTLLKHNYRNVMAVDIDKTRFGLPEVEFCVADLNQHFSHQLGEDLFDGIVALEVIEHLENPWHFLRECRLLLKCGGVLVLSSPNVESLPSRLLFLRTGRLLFFTDRVRKKTGHITPVFSWSLSPMLKGSAFQLLETRFNRRAWPTGSALRDHVAGIASSLLSPFALNDSQGEARIVAARAV